MGSYINTTKDFNTNGIVIPAGEVSEEQIRDILKLEKAEDAKTVLKDLQQRQATYDRYREGIHEKHEHMSSAGTVAMGGE